jgi:hypothetical protein
MAIVTWVKRAFIGDRATVDAETITYSGPVWKMRTRLSEVSAGKPTVGLETSDGSSCSRSLELNSTDTEPKPLWIGCVEAFPYCVDGAKGTSEDFVSFYGSIQDLVLTRLQK